MKNRKVAKNFSKFKYESVFFATMPWGNQLLKNRLQRF